ncbi:MAG: GntR family transcriptional regulator [Desulfurispora sp.]|uniref:GntR family transcriptional regulator n=1 Tax=Desulfurispora sp. TaxID=3014275 RepID=UPI00404A32AA
MLKKEALKNMVYEFISRKIQNGELMPNQKVTELEICRELGVSRTPVREALIQLAADNLLEKIPNRGFFVKQVDKGEKLEIYDVLSILDGHAGYLAASRVDEVDITEMQELTEKIDIAIKYRKFNEYARLQNLFHDIYINKCGNSTLIKLLNSLRYNFIPQTYISHDDAQQERLFKILSFCNEQHKELLDCFRRGDAAGARAVLEKHWKTIDYELI